MKIPSLNILKTILPHGVNVFTRKRKDLAKIRKNNDFENESENEFFDIILSVGAACRTAHYLEKHGLRFCSNPLDWMMAYSLDTVIHLYKTGFNDFFVDFVEDKQKSLDYNCHWYIDNRNSITSMHYKKIGNDAKAFRKMMMNRFEKINRILLTCERICFISDRDEDNIVFKRFLKETGEMYSGKITYINIRSNKEMTLPSPVNYCREKISERLEFIEYEFNDIHPQGDDLRINKDAWIGNYNIWDDIMGKIFIKRKMNFFSNLFNGWRH